MILGVLKFGLLMLSEMMFFILEVFLKSFFIFDFWRMFILLVMKYFFFLYFIDVFFGQFGNDKGSYINLFNRIVKNVVKIFIKF